MEEYFVYGLKITKSKAKQKVLDTSDNRLFYWILKGTQKVLLYWTNKSLDLDARMES